MSLEEKKKKENTDFTKTYQSIIDFEMLTYNGGGEALTNLPHAPHDTELLCVYEALQHDPYSHVDIIFQYIVPQVHLGMSFSHADHRFNVTNCDGDAACGLLVTQNQHGGSFNN